MFALFWRKYPPRSHSLTQSHGWGRQSRRLLRPSLPGPLTPATPPPLPPVTTPSVPAASARRPAGTSFRQEAWHRAYQVDPPPLVAASLPPATAAHSLTHSPPQTDTHSITHSLTPVITHSLTHFSLPHSPLTPHFPSPPHVFRFRHPRRSEQVLRALPGHQPLRGEHSLTHSLTHSYTH
jgi:hypothetical protein